MSWASSFEKTAVYTRQIKSSREDVLSESWRIISISERENLDKTTLLIFYLSVVYHRK